MHNNTRASESRGAGPAAVGDLTDEWQYAGRPTPGRQAAAVKDLPDA